MCAVTRRDNIRNEHIRGVVQASKKITEKRQKWYDQMIMKEEHIGLYRDVWIAAITPITVWRL